MQMRMPFKNQLGSSELHLDGKFCALGWILFQSGEGTDEIEKHSNYDVGVLKSLGRWGTDKVWRRFDALIDDNSLDEAIAYIAEIMTQLNQEPVFDAYTSEPYWMTPEPPTNEEQPNEHENAELGSVRSLLLSHQG